MSDNLLETIGKFIVEFAVIVAMCSIIVFVTVKAMKYAWTGTW